MDELTKLYEKRTGKKLKTFRDKTKESSQRALDIDLDTENEYLDEILTKIDKLGIEKVGYDEMNKFKGLVARRIEIFSKLQEELDAHLEQGHEVNVEPEMQTVLRQIHTFRSSKQFEKTFYDGQATEPPQSSFRSSF
mmetsp:Transcript_19513/g.16707  ORF Transcript_19513/g.16707 Transcript_19513/m.16707 type:complete len:137 (+) Transcript_19513:227-637(+)